MVAALPVEYVLPLRWSGGEDLAELTDYLRCLRSWADVTVVDGSPPALFDRHARAWDGLVRHLAPEPWPGANGKVAGVVTGVRHARHEVIVVADDDVRYDRKTLGEVVTLLARGDLVRPQNVYTALPWQARWDTGRILLNRALGSDHPGTLALRRSTFTAMGGYDGDVLFENLELVRTVRAAGGVVVDAPGVFVGRLPPALSHFTGQRVRQAYDDLAQPARLVTELAVLPTLAAAALRRPAALPALAAGVVALAEVGRRRAGGSVAFTATAALWAPAWLLERSVCVWAALGYRLTGGMPYAGGRLVRAASSSARLRTAFGARDGEGPGRGPLQPGAVRGETRPVQGAVP